MEEVIVRKGTRYGNEGTGRRRESRGDVGWVRKAGEMRDGQESEEGFRRNDWETEVECIGRQVGKYIIG